MTDREAMLESQLEQARAETRAAFENRALVYAYVFDELSKELGDERATAIMKRATYRRGREIGRKYREECDWERAERGDLDEVGRLFVESSPSGGALFQPSIDEPAEGGRTVLKMTACPLVDAWREAGYSAERVDLLCEIASAIDHGTFEEAGLDLRFLDRQPCPAGESCRLELKLRGEST